MVWLNANEFPGGPPSAAITAMTKVLNQSNRYHYEEFASFLSTLAEDLNLTPDKILVGAGSTEVLHCAIEAFVNPKSPFLTAWPTFEAGAELTAAKGYGVVKVPLTDNYSADVQRLAQAAHRAGGGLIYICNPNNPTSSITPKQDIRWLVDHLPDNTYLLIDEAYIHFANSEGIGSAVEFVQSNKNVIVLRTFSKIYGMAGLRVGLAMARPELIARMTPYRNNVISILGVRAVLAALNLGPKFLDQRRGSIARTRSAFTAWCKEKGVQYIEPHANFVMIETIRDVRELGPALLAKGIAVGRPFPPFYNKMRISVGADDDMEKFKAAFSELLGL